MDTPKPSHLAVISGEGDAQSQAPYLFKFHGTGGAFLLLLLKNALFSILTLGIYIPWAKTNTRRFLWQNTEFAGQRFMYTGTGLELFKGYLKVGVVYALVWGGMTALHRYDPKVALAVGGFVGFAVAHLVM